LIGIRFSHLVQGSYQFDLFDDMTEKVMLYSAMDKLRDRFGENIIQRASIVGMKKREFLNPFKG
jgi:DNA polymerase-4